jgi:hypothetical protein
MLETVTITREEYEGLSESAALFRQIADSAPVLIWLTGTDALCTWFNKPFNCLFDLLKSCDRAAIDLEAIERIALFTSENEGIEGLLHRQN